jgi:hypothetical protein
MLPPLGIRVLEPRGFVPSATGTTLELLKNVELPSRIGEPEVGLRDGFDAGDMLVLADDSLGVQARANAMRSSMLLRLYGTIPGKPASRDAAEQHVKHLMNMLLAAHLLWLHRTQGVLPDDAWGMFKDVVPLRCRGGTDGAAVSYFAWRHCLGGIPASAMLLQSVVEGCLCRCTMAAMKQQGRACV